MKRINHKPMRVLLVAGTAFASLILTACSFNIGFGGSSSTTPGSSTNLPSFSPSTPGPDVPPSTPGSSVLPSIPPSSSIPPSTQIPPSSSIPPSTQIPPSTSSPDIEVKSITLRTNKDILSIGEKADLFTISQQGVITDQNLSYQIIEGSFYATLSGSTLTAIDNGTVVVKATLGGLSSQELTIAIEDLSYDLYDGVDQDSFYAHYREATSSDDARYRTAHNLMSGSIEEQVQEPTISSSRPEEGSKFLRNNTAYYSDDKETYFIVDDEGAIVDRVYRGGAYVSLEEVAAYVYAFGDIPPNYSSNKGTRPSSSPWRKWLRVNNTLFSGDVNKYPYEPALPRISGIGGDLNYYEIDIGTTGTDCDPNYEIAPYNNGSSIVRGAARIVYVRENSDGSAITNLDERYVFYTFNHYNDFQEYLNYQNGWGEMFGNITGGGTLSSKYDYNPTPYVDVAFRDFSLLIRGPQKLLQYLANWKDEYLFALI